jgi:hypothetical protein
MESSSSYSVAEKHQQHRHPHGALTSTDFAIEEEMIDLFGL